MPYRIITGLGDVNRTQKDTLESQQCLNSTWKIIESIQLLHESTNDRDEYLLRIITETEIDNDAIGLILFAINLDIQGECDMNRC